MKKPDSIFVAGHRGLVGSALVRELTRLNYTSVITCTRADLNLMDTAKVHKFFRTEKPQYVFLAAAKVGGIYANNTYGADFIYENLTIQTNIIKAAHDTQVKKLLFLGSSCIYPKQAHQPISESALMTGPLEETNKPYAMAKIAGITMCQAFRKQYGDNFISVMPTNLYGPNDNFELENSHVLPALLRKFHDAKINHEPHVTIWGTGTPRREFLHVDDLAKACVFLMQTYNDGEIVNIGTGEDVSIKQLATLIKKTVGYRGDLVFDLTKPDGTKRKRLDVTKINRLGWHASIPLADGLAQTYRWFVNQPHPR